MTYAAPGTTTTVTVPAGTFQAVRVHVHECNLTQNGCGDIDPWYAPAAKWFVKTTYANTNFWGRAAGQSTVLTQP